jgi:hypothetical protein
LSSPYRQSVWVTFGPKVMIGRVKWFTHAGGIWPYQA